MAILLHEHKETVECDIALRTGSSDIGLSREYFGPSIMVVRQRYCVIEDFDDDKKGANAVRQ